MVLFVEGLNRAKMFGVAAARGAESASNMTGLEGGSEVFSHVGQECSAPDFLSH